MKIYVSLFILSHIALNAHATIVSGKELFSPQLKQTVLLFGDMHWQAPQIDTTQIADVIKNLTKYKPVMLFEGFQEKQGGDKFLEKLYPECMNNNLDHKALEYRIAGGAFRFFNDEMMTHNSYSQIKELFSQKDTQKKIFYLFTQSIKECNEKQEELYKKLDQIFETKTNHPLAANAEKYFFESVQKRDTIMAMLPPQQKNPEEEAASIAHFIFKDFFVPNSNSKTIILNKKSIIHQLEELGDSLLELDAFLEIINNDKKIISVFTGLKHTSALSKLLKKNSFEKKYSSLNQKKEIDATLHELLKTTSSKSVLELGSSPELHKFALDIKTFLEKCSFYSKRQL